MKDIFKAKESLTTFDAQKLMNKAIEEEMEVWTEKEYDGDVYCITIVPYSEEGADLKWHADISRETPDGHVGLLLYSPNLNAEELVEMLNSYVRQHIVDIEFNRKVDWIRNATNEELLMQFASNSATSIMDECNRYGDSYENTKSLRALVKSEILSRMGFERN